MRPPLKCENGPRRGAAIAEQTDIMTNGDQAADTAECISPGEIAGVLVLAGVAVVQAEEYPRDQRRKWPLIIVKRCPHCRASHAHRAFGVRDAPCGTTYLVVEP